MEESCQQKNPAAAPSGLAPIQSRLPIRIICVVSELGDANTELIQKIKEYVLESNLLFETREFDSWKFRHDRANIERLPAFHIYTRTNHMRTFYPNTRPYQHILEVKAEYLKSLEKRTNIVKKKSVFSINPIGYLKRLMRRRDKLDQVTYSNTIQNSRLSFRGNTIEWE